MEYSIYSSSKISETRNKMKGMQRAGWRPKHGRTDHSIRVLPIGSVLKPLTCSKFSKSIRTCCRSVPLRCKSQSLSQGGGGGQYPDRDHSQHNTMYCIIPEQHHGDRAHMGPKRAPLAVPPAAV